MPDCTSATPHMLWGVSLCREGTLSLWLTRSALRATIAIPSLCSLRVPSTAPSSPQGNSRRCPHFRADFLHPNLRLLFASRKCKPFTRSSFSASRKTIALSLIFAPRHIPTRHHFMTSAKQVPSRVLSLLQGNSRRCPHFRADFLHPSLRLLFASRKCKPFTRSSFSASRKTIALSLIFAPRHIPTRHHFMTSVGRDSLPVADATGTQI